MVPWPWASPHGKGHAKVIILFAISAKRSLTISSCGSGLHPVAQHTTERQTDIATYRLNLPLNLKLLPLGNMQEIEPIKSYMEATTAGQGEQLAMDKGRVAHPSTASTTLVYD